MGVYYHFYFIGWVLRAVVLELEYSANSWSRTLKEDSYAQEVSKQSCCYYSHPYGSALEKLGNRGGNVPRGE